MDSKIEHMIRSSTQAVKRQRISHSDLLGNTHNSLYTRGYKTAYMYRYETLPITWGSLGLNRLWGGGSVAVPCLADAALYVPVLCGL